MVGVFVDVETGGLDSKVHALTEIGAAAFEYGEQMQIIGTFQEKVLPESYLSLTPYAVSLQRKEWNEVVNRGVLERDACQNFVRWAQSFVQQPHQIWAHNAPFDHGFLQAAYARHSLPSALVPARCEWNCTRQLFNLLIFLGKKKSQSISLDTIAQHYGLLTAFVQDRRHGAFVDAELGVWCLEKMLKDLER